MFDGYIAVDWSASKKRVYGEDSIWVATKINGKENPQPENFPTRHSAMVHIVTLLNQANEECHRLLCGFDFPFGYPEGTARILTGRDSWESVWELIGGAVSDNDDNNDNDRFEAAARLNARFEGEGPFWVASERDQVNGLLPRQPRNRWGVNLPPYRRHIERVFPGNSVWQLSGQGAAGSQALLGIARLEKLRRRCDVQVWPFETLGEGRHHVLAEIYPSLIEPDPEEAVSDAGQVKAVANRLQKLDSAERLLGRLRAPNRMPAVVRTEEALFLDIT